VSEQASTVSSDLSNARTRKSSKKASSDSRAAKHDNNTDTLKLCVQLSSVHIVQDMQGIAHMSTVLFGRHAPELMSGSDQHMRNARDAMAHSRAEQDLQDSNSITQADHQSNAAACQQSGSFHADLVQRDRTDEFRASEADMVSAQMAVLSIPDYGMDSLSPRARQRNGEQTLQAAHGADMRPQVLCAAAVCESKMQLAAAADALYQAASSQDTLHAEAADLKAQTAPGLIQTGAACECDVAASRAAERVDCVGIDAEWRPGDNPVRLPLP
jgi:hypothetical protein